MASYAGVQDELAGKLKSFGGYLVDIATSRRYLPSFTLVARIVALAPELDMSIESVLTVCTGNICRSPLAEALLRVKQPGLKVASAGVGALVGRQADTNTQIVAREHCLDVSLHVARQVDAQLIRDHELVLAMELRQVKWIVRHFPEARGRVFLVGNWSDNAEVPDPYRLALDRHRKSYSIMAKYIEQWCAHFV